MFAERTPRHASTWSTGQPTTTHRAARPLDSTRERTRRRSRRRRTTASGARRSPAHRAPTRESIRFHSIPSLILSLSLSLLFSLYSPLASRPAPPLASSALLTQRSVRCSVASRFLSSTYAYTIHSLRSLQPTLQCTLINYAHQQYLSYSLCLMYMYCICLAQAHLT